VPSFWTIDELSLLVSRNGNPSETLTNVVTLIRQRFNTDVWLDLSPRARSRESGCSPHRGTPAGERRTGRMRVTEGLAGLVAEQ
jgi:hypothetical protein